MPIQAPRVRANLMTNKELNKVQNEVKKTNEKTLTGAVKNGAACLNPAKK